MRRNHDYRDGYVDRATGAALSENGVTKFRYPRTAYFVERTGSIIEALLRMYSRSHTVSRLYGLPESRAETVLFQPAALRRIGSVTLAAGLSVAAVTVGPELADTGRTILDRAYEQLDMDYTPPSIDFNRLLDF